MATSTDVTINDVQYSILSAPPESSAVVLAERDALNGSLDLKTLVDDLASVGQFISIAYNAINASGPKHGIAELLIEVQNLGYDITKLCDKSAVTVSSFKSTSQRILMELQAAYQYLLDGLEDMAVDSLACLSTLAEKMAKAAYELQQNFEEQEKKVKTALGNTIKTKIKEETHAIEMEERQKELVHLEKRQKELIDESRVNEEEARKSREEYERKEDEEIGKIKTGVMETVLNAVTSHVKLGTMLFGSSRKDARERQGEWKKKSVRQLEIEKEFRKQRNERLGKLTEFLMEMEKRKSEQSESETAATFLHQACGALKELSAVMMRAALFWTQLQKHCQSLAEYGIKDQIERCMQRDSEEKRLRIWTSTGFKVKAVTYYAKWVALHGMCHEYMGHIRNTQGKLYKYISENPTRNESRDSLPELVKNFSADISSAQENIKRLDFKADEDIKRIEQIENIDE